MQSTISAQLLDGTTVIGWLHRAKPDNSKLVIICPGHNTEGSNGRFIELAKWLSANGIDALRLNITRKEIAPGITEVTTISEEVEQARALAQTMRDKYQYIVAAGHSQGGIMALMLAQAHLADAVVQLMSVADEKIRIPRLTERFVKTKNTVGYAPYEKFGKTFGYTEAFFTDYRAWHIHDILAQNTKPILFVLAKDDEMVSAAEVRGGFEITGGDKELFEVSGMHNFSNETAAIIAKKIISWMQ